LDFIIERRGLPPIAIEAKWNSRDFNYPGLKSFMNRYPSAEVFVVTSDLSYSSIKKIDGISIIGTTGIVRPMSLDSFKVSLLCGLDVAKAAGHDSIVLVPGSIGETGFHRHFSISKYQVIQMSNFVGFMLDEAVKRKFKSIIIGGHPGKLAKLIRGDFYTHSSKSKPANNILIKIFKREKISSALINELNDSSTVEGMVEIIKEHNVMQVFDRIADDVQTSVDHYIFLVRPGRVLFEIDGVSEADAIQALKRAGNKLPVKTRVIRKNID